MKLVKEVKNGEYVFQMEIIIRAVYHGCHVEEIPITFVDRVIGKSKLGMGKLLFILILFWSCIRNKKYEINDGFIFFFGFK